jgi:HAMP domain-containing protein
LINTYQTISLPIIIIQNLLIQAIIVLLNVADNFAPSPNLPPLIPLKNSRHNVILNKKNENLNIKIKFSNE